MKFSVPDDLFKKMKKYPNVYWSSIAQSAVEKYIENLEITDKIALKSKLSSEDAETIGNDLKRRSWEFHKKSLDKMTDC